MAQPAVRINPNNLTFTQRKTRIKFFNFYMVNKKNRKLTKDEINERWSNYKDHVYQRCGYRIENSINAEVVFIKRMSNPLKFLQLKLRRTDTLRVADLEDIDQAWYREIGGPKDVASLLQRASFEKFIYSIR